METIIPIYDQTGTQINVLEIPDKLNYINGRVSLGTKHYYKGAGVPYRGHRISDISNIDRSEFVYIKKSDVFYEGYTVIKKCYIDKFGIFQERYQIFFPDFIGSCSVKEGTIVLNSSLFEKTSVDIIDCIEFDKENNQSYYILNYFCNRKRYIEDDGDPKKLRELIEYTLATNWNFLWDKATITDISNTGLVSDPADLFLSTELNHKFGSVYSVLYSLGKKNMQKYLEFIKQYDLHHPDDRFYVFNTSKILEHNNIDVSELFPFQNALENYKHIILNYLLTGQNCAYCACNMFKHQGDIVRDQYIENIKKQISNT